MRSSVAARPHAARIWGVWGLLGILGLTVASLATAQESGQQITPDREHVLVSKDVGAERWAIARNLDDGTATGNVFFSGGEDPQFVWCEQTGQSEADLLYACWGATQCPLAPCTSGQWIFISEVTLPRSFFGDTSEAATARADWTVAQAAGVGQATSTRPSGRQVTRDGKRQLVSKDVGEERWVITRNLETGTVSGNVYFPGGGEPRFLWCAETGVGSSGLELECLGANRCPAPPCGGEEQWTFIADVELPTSFFSAPEWVDRETLADEMAATLGPEGAFDALLLSLDRGYSLRQIVDAALTGRLSIDGRITHRAGGAETPEGPPLGIFVETTASGLASAAAYRLSEVRGKALEITEKNGDVLGIALLDLVDIGYGPEEITEALIVGRVRWSLSSHPFDPDEREGWSYWVVDDKGKPLLPGTPNSGILRKAGVCGNGTAENVEDCDGFDLRDQSCMTQGFAGGGTLRCSPTCQFDTIDCLGDPSCGNGTAENDELCDGIDLRGETCESQGFSGGGSLRCTNVCTLDTSGCSIGASCGDGQATGAEDCDGSDLRGANCFTLGFEGGGELSCTGACLFDTSACRTCGDGVAAGAEECDGGDLRGQTCESQGFAGGGTLACTGSCQLDTSGCFEQPPCTGTLCPDGSCAPIGGQCCPAGGFCDAGNVCVTGGCCPAAAPQVCGGFCIPESADCCGNGTYCNPGYLCTGTEICCAQTTPQLCGSNCIPSDWKCCGGGIACAADYVCVPGGCCHESEPQPCPDGSCTLPGWVCCGDLTSCPPGTVCSAGSCLPA